MNKYVFFACPTCEYNFGPFKPVDLRRKTKEGIWRCRSSAARMKNKRYEPHRYSAAELLVVNTRIHEAMNR